jgi:hypothetical protein
MKYAMNDDDWGEVERAVRLRIEESSQQGLNHASTYERSMDERLEQERVGAGAELAWARLNERLWHNPINEFHQVPDDGMNEIRATSHPRGGLIIRDNDPSDRVYIFAQLIGNVFFFIGWAYGHEAKRDENLFNPNGWRQSWRLGKHQLHPMKTLPASQPR